MDVKQAVKLAKDHIADLYRDEEILNVGLEEVELDDERVWRITIGFSRPWDRKIGNVLSGEDPRSYKIVLINEENGYVFAVKDWKISKAL